MNNTDLSNRLSALENGWTWLEACAFNAAVTLKGAVTSDVLQAATYGAGLVGTSSFGAPKTYRRTENGIIITTIKFDLTGLASVGTTEDAIGLAAGGIACLYRNVVATNGIIFKAELACLETPVGGATDIDIATNVSGTIPYGDALSTVKLINGASKVIGQTLENLVPAITADHYLYIAEGTGSGGTYTAGMFILRMYGHAVLA